MSGVLHAVAELMQMTPESLCDLKTIALAAKQLLHALQPKSACNVMH